MKIKYFLLLFLFVSQAFASSENFKHERDTVIQDALITFKHSMLNKGFLIVGIGEGVDHETSKQNFLKIVFTIERLPNVEFARSIEVEILNQFLICINSQENIEPYLAEYPFPIKFVKITFISNHPQDGLFSVTNNENELIYCMQNPLNTISLPIDVYRESYDEAICILSKEKHL